MGRFAEPWLLHRERSASSALLLGRWHVCCCDPLMANPIELVTPPRPRVRSLGAPAWWRAGVCAAGLTLCASPLLAAESSKAPIVTAQVPGAPPVPGLPPNPMPGGDPTFPREPDPTGIEVPDEVTADQLKGQYGVGLGLLILGGIITAGAVIALFVLVVRKPWAEPHSQSG